MDQKPEAPATDRNREPILDVLRTELKDSKSVLEIGSGTGQHAVFFGCNLPWLNWQTSDRLENHNGIRAWLNESKLENVYAPLNLDVERVDASPDIYDAVFSANTAHIMSLDAVVCMFRIVGNCLSPGGCFCLYGPFMIGGEQTSESNRRFDESLKVQDPEMGIRELDMLHELASANGLRHKRSYAMPANNMLVVWRKNEHKQGGDHGDS